MSKPSAIAAVTETLRTLIAREGIVSDVTAMAPDLAAAPGSRRVNLFLYHVGPNPELRNQEFPWQGRSGGDTQKNPPPFMLPLRLHYMLTAFADDDVSAHEALGHAMRVLHDHAHITAKEIRDAVTSSPRVPDDDDLHLQPERVKVTMLTTPIDEMTKIWTAFQSAYRLSVAYEVSVVLIESERPAASPKPVLNRGPGDQGVLTFTGSRVPRIDRLLNATTSAAFNTGQTGAKVVIEGRNFGDVPLVLLRRVLDTGDTGTAIEPVVEASSPDGAQRLSIELKAADNTAAGPHSLAVAVPDPANPPTVRDGGERWWRSNELTFGIAPKLLADPEVAADNQTLTFSVEPGVLDTQRVRVLINDRERKASFDLTAPAAPVATLDEALSTGTYGVRLNVDGVDLPLIGPDPTDPLGRRLRFLPERQIIIPSSPPTPPPPVTPPFMP